VTRKGGGAAIPVKPRLLASIIRAAVKNAEHVPITIKVRLGIYDRLLTFMSAGRVAEDLGCAAITLHARTVAQFYDGNANWDAIRELKESISIPVWGNGDVWEAGDALRMMRQTGCDAVVVGRGCLGRPWLFRDLADVFNGRQPQTPPHLGEVAEVMLEHARLLVEWLGEGPAMRAFRRQATWYTKGFRDSARLRDRLMRLRTLDELNLILSEADATLRFPPLAMRMPRGKSSGRQRVSLPDGYLDDLSDDTPPRDDGTVVSGG
jgi:nifR3 family TIM-barrel protein